LVSLIIYYGVISYSKTQYYHSLPEVSYDEDVFVYCFSLEQIKVLFIIYPNFLIYCSGSYSIISVLIDQNNDITKLVTIYSLNPLG